MDLKLRRSDNPRVSVIIPCSVRTDLLLNCLRSLALFAPADNPHETIVVLNGADAGAEANLRAAASGVTLVRSPEKEQIGQAHAALWHDKQALEQANASLAQEKDALAQAHAALLHQQHKAEQPIGALRQAYQALLHSGGRHITAPLRAAARRLRKLLR
jgi:hypothetical protein